MKRILVPTDFSTCAYNAVEFAVQSAKQMNASILLLHSYETEGSIYTDYVGLNNSFKASLLADARKKLADIKRAIEKIEPVKVDTYVAVTPVVDAIITATKEFDIDMIVMGTLGVSELRDKLWGSITAALIGTSRVPVMLIPFEYEWRTPANLLLTSNHFQKEPAVMKFLFAMADLYRARVTVAVMTDVDHDGAATFMEHNRTVALYEKLLQDQYADKSPAVAHLYGDDPEETLQDYIAQNEVDILVMITCSQGFWKRLLFPDTTKQMSYHTRIPMLALPSIWMELNQHNKKTGLKVPNYSINKFALPWFGPQNGVEN